MAVAFDAILPGGSLGVNNGTTVSATTLTVGAGSNRALVVMLAFAATAANTPPTGVSVTWDVGGTNQALSLIRTVNNPTPGLGNGYTLQVWGLVNPISGNKTLTASWTLANDCTMVPVAVTGANQAGGSATFANATSAEDTTGSTATATVTVTSTVGDLIVAQHIGGLTATATVFSSNNNTNIVTSAATTKSLVSANRAAGAATVTLTATQDATDVWASHGVSITQVPATTPTGWLRQQNQIKPPPAPYLGETLVYAIPPIPAVANTATGVPWIQPLSRPAAALPPWNGGATLAPYPTPSVANTINSLAWLPPLSPPAAPLPPWKGGVVWAPTTLTTAFNTVTQIGWFRPLSGPAPALPPTVGGVDVLLTFQPTVLNTINSVAWIQPLSPPAYPLPAWVGGAVLPPFPYTTVINPNIITDVGFYRNLSPPAPALPPWLGGATLAPFPTPAIANSITGMGWYQNLSRPAPALPPWLGGATLVPFPTAAINNNIAGLGWYRNLAAPAPALPPWRGGAVWSNFLPPYLNTIEGMGWYQPLSPPQVGAGPIIVPTQGPLIPPEIPPIPPPPRIPEFGGSGYAHRSITAIRARTNSLPPGMTRAEFEYLLRTVHEEERQALINQMDDDEMAIILLNLDSSNLQ